MHHQHDTYTTHRYREGHATDHNDYKQYHYYYFFCAEL
jgi:hypothetical protein